MSKRNKAPKPEYSVAVPARVFVVVGPRGGLSIHRSPAAAQREYARQQARRDKQIGDGIDVGTDPMIVAFTPEIATPAFRRLPPPPRKR